MRPTCPSASGERGSASSRRRPLPTRATSPSRPLGTGITLDQPLANDHAINAVVRDAAGHDRGLPGDSGAQPVVRRPAPFGPDVAPATWCCVTPPAWSSTASTTAASSTRGPPRATRPPPEPARVAAACLRPARAEAGFGGPARSGRRRPIGARAASRTAATPTATATISCCRPPPPWRPLRPPARTTSKSPAWTDFGAGQTIMIDTGANRETAVIATVGTAGGTTVGTATEAGATVIPVANAIGFSAGQTITIDSGANLETAVVVSDPPRLPGRLPGPPWPRRHHHRRRAAHLCARGRRGGLRHRHHPHHGIDPGACQRGAGLQQCPTPGAPNRYYRSGSGR